MARRPLCASDSPLSQRAGLHLFEGDFAAAASLIEEAGEITAARAAGCRSTVPLGLSAFRHRELETSELVKVNTRKMVRRGEGVGLTFNPRHRLPPNNDDSQHFSAPRTLVSDPDQNPMPLAWVCATSSF
jgi:hypothetical protein